MLQALLQIIDRLIRLAEGRLESRKEVFSSVLEPTFNDLLLIHRDYIAMFEQLQVFRGAIPEDDSEIQRRLQSSKTQLHQRRIEFEPVRQKVRALVATIAHRKLPVEERRFVDAVLRYFPSADPSLPQSAATTVLEYLERAAPAELDLLIDATLQRHRNAWSDVCSEYAALRITIAQLR